MLLIVFVVSVSLLLPRSVLTAKSRQYACSYVRVGKPIMGINQFQMVEMQKP